MAAKRQKTGMPHSLLLDTQPEILRKVYSFSSLREVLPLCQVHRQFNEARNDIYQCSFITWKDTLLNRGFEIFILKYIKNQ